MRSPKAINEVLSAPEPHWVGDGFPVRTMFSVRAHDPAAISPFLLLDYAGPHDFPPSDSGKPRGVDQHPHRGFETVTILYHGELEHRDSSGTTSGSGKLGPGDVQWMTAASGIIHEEKHAENFTRRGGTLEMIQLWVNLPAEAKNERPRYQDIRRDSIPSIDLPGNAGSLRVIAGDYNATQGPAKTYTPINVWDAQLNAGASTTFDLPADTNTLVLILHGDATLNETQFTAPRGALLSRTGELITISAGDHGAAVLVLNGEPIDEPVVAHGPFVMNTRDEINKAMADYQSGRMGHLEPLAQ